MPKHNRNSVAKLRALETSRKAFELRLGGAGYVRIGEALGMSAAGAWKAIDRHVTMIRDTLDEDTEKLRTLELARIDEIYPRFHIRAMGGDDKAAATCVRLMERRAKLMGLDAPVKSDVSGDMVFRVIRPDLPPPLNPYQPQIEESTDGETPNA